MSAPPRDGAARVTASDPAPWRVRVPGSLAVAAAFGFGLAVFLYRQWRLAGSASLDAFPLDDSWIHLQFARNLAEGHGFSYNPGVPVGGSTAPLWTLLLAAAFALLGSHPALAKGLGILAALGAALAARRLAQRWSGDPALGVAAGVATALSGPMLWGALSGMEVALAALLVTAGLCVRPAASAWIPALLLGLAALARPEAVILVPLVVLAGPLRGRRVAVSAGVVALVLAPWAVFNLWTTGSPLPATASAKVTGGLVGLLAGLREPVRTALIERPWQFEVEWVRWLWRANALVPVLAIVGLCGLWRRLGPGHRRAMLPAAALVLHPLAMALLAPYRGPGFQGGRYSIQLLPLALAVAAVGIGWVGASAPGLRRVGAAALVIASLWTLWPAAGRYGWAVQNIEAMEVRLGRWAAAETPAAARLAVNDVGAIAYLSRRHIIDLIGLVTPAITPYRREGDAGVLRFLERACPDYLIVFPRWFPEMSARADLFTPVERVQLEYNTVAGDDEMVVYETVWNRWRVAPRPCPAVARPGG